MTRKKTGRWTPLAVVVSFIALTGAASAADLDDPNLDPNWPCKADPKNPPYCMRPCRTDTYASQRRFICAAPPSRVNSRKVTRP